MTRFFLIAAIWCTTLLTTSGQVIANNTSHTQYASENNKNNCTVVINEFMSARQRIMDGDYEDWIELYNCTDKEIDLSGWYKCRGISNVGKPLVA